MILHADIGVLRLWSGKDGYHVKLNTSEALSEPKQIAVANGSVIFVASKAKGLYKLIPKYFELEQDLKLIDAVPDESKTPTITLRSIANDFTVSDPSDYIITISYQCNNTFLKTTGYALNVSSGFIIFEFESDCLDAYTYITAIVTHKEGTSSGNITAAYVRPSIDLFVASDPVRPLVVKNLSPVTIRDTGFDTSRGVQYSTCAFS
eukprot:GEZU01027164.1.p1 GENE.GEZU01027164.1~~GEZU01027164.1.p1  ORF type:complete len:206 (-),score=36.68 GEZU01027164.1:751-1368(-)